MRVVTIGGGPAGLYFAILVKKADPAREVIVLERNRADDTFGFGVVFSDATLDHFREADADSHAAIARALAHWDDIDIHYQGHVITARGHGFAGLARQRLLDVLQARAAALGVTLRFSTEVASPAVGDGADLVVAADGVNSWMRARHAARFGPEIDWRRNRFVWLGTTYPFSAFTFMFKEDAHGLWRVHAYRYDAGHSTFILETTEDTWRRAGLEEASESDTVAFAQALFARELDGHAVLKNRSLWRGFPTVRNARWHHDNVVLVGDAAHTAHFSIGSGTKLAMEDAIALARALDAHHDVARALPAYEAERRPQVEALQRAAQASLEWFEQTERYHGRLEPAQFAFSLLSRSRRVTYDSLRARDATLVAGVDRWFAERAAQQSGLAVPAAPAPPPMFTPFRLREVVLPNRVVAGPVCEEGAKDGTPGDRQLAQLGRWAGGGAGLVMAEMTAVRPEGRIGPGSTGMYRPEHVAAWRRIVDVVHGVSAVRVGIQLGHAGRKGATQGWARTAEPLAQGYWPLVSASPLPYVARGRVPREMDRRDMDAVRDAFAQAAVMAAEAGFDLLELQLGHGFLLASFLSPLTNHRTDEHGGPLARRLRFPLEVLAAVRGAWPADRPLGARISATDWHEGGLSPDEAVQIAHALKAHGCDLVDVSAGGTVADESPSSGRLFQTPFSDRIRHEVDIPTVTSGGLTSHGDVNSVLAAGRADLCALGHAHLDNPDWTHQAARAQGITQTGFMSRSMK